MINEWKNRWRKNPSNFNEDGTTNTRGFVRASLYFIAYDIIAKGIYFALAIGLIVLGIWSIWGMTWGIISMCKAF